MLIDSHGGKVRSRSFFAFVLSAIAGLLLAPHYALCQGAVGGVMIDADGVIRVRKTGSSAKLKQLKADRKDAKDGAIFISLNKLFKEVEALTAAGKTLPDNIRYLDGMVKLKYVFAYPEEKDLVIAGRAEPFDASASPERPLGKITGRPVLRLEDLVVALRRAFGPTGKSRVFGCSLDLPQGGIERMQSAGQQIGALSGNFGAAAKKFAKAVGPQDVRIFGVPPNTNFAFVCIEADYIMKRLALGIDSPPVKDVKSHLSLMKPNESVYSRYWFTPMYEPVLVSEDGTAFEIRGQGLQIRSSSSDRANDDATPSAKKFVELATAKFPEMAAVVPAYADLWNLTDLAVLAALIRHDRLDQKTNLDIQWLDDPAKFKVAEGNVPTTAETLVNYKASGRSVHFAIGGVEVAPGRIVDEKSRSVDKSGKLREVALTKIKSGWSLRVDM